MASKNTQWVRTGSTPRASAPAPAVPAAAPVSAPAPPATAVDDTGLPEGWFAYLDKKSGEHYYHNPATQSTQWGCPVPVLPAPCVVPAKAVAEGGNPWSRWNGTGGISSEGAPRPDPCPGPLASTPFPKRPPSNPSWQPHVPCLLHEALDPRECTYILYIIYYILVAHRAD